MEKKVRKEIVDGNGKSFRSERAASSHDLHGLFLVDEADRLVGIINNQDLLQWGQIHLDLPLPATSVTLGQVRRLVKARQARDLARPGSAEAAVREDDTLDTALNRMARYGLTAIPVVDEQGRVVNDLRLSEILAYALEKADITLVGSINSSAGA